MSKRSLGVLSLVILAATLLPSQAATGSAETTFIQRQLDNGLTVAIEERPTSRTAGVVVLIRAGSRDDGLSPGLLSFLARAHLLGTTRRPSRDAVIQTINSTGGALSGGASRETTQFSVNVPAEELDTALDLLADILQDSLFDEEAIEREKTVVRLEIARRLANPQADLFFSAFFGQHPLGHPVIGNAESVAALTREQLLGARDRYYGARNMAIGIVGKVRAEEIIPKMEDRFGGMPPGARAPIVPAPLEAPTQIRRVEKQGGQQQANVLLAVPGPPAGDDDWYAFVVLDNLLGLPSGRIATEIREKRGLAYAAGSGLIAFTDAAAWVAGAGTDPENVEQVIILLVTEMARIRQQPVSEEELAAAVGNLRGGLILSDESNLARAERIAERALSGLEEAEGTTLERLEQVTAEDVARVARKYFLLDRYVLVVVKP